MSSLQVLSVGMLVEIIPESGDQPARWSALGSCFPFRLRTHFLTAAHCLGNLEAKDVSVLGEFYRSLKPAARIVRHPTADLAVVIFDRSPAEPAEISMPYSKIDRRNSLGTDIATFGFPIDSLGDRGNFPTVRMMKGHIQRQVFSNAEFGRSQPGVETTGVELSFPTDAGLSGAPVFRPAASSVIGIVNGTVESCVRAKTIEDSTDEEGRHKRVVRQEFLCFGLAVTLSQFETWLDKEIPTVSCGTEPRARQG